MASKLETTCSLECQPPTPPRSQQCIVMYSMCCLYVCLFMWWAGIRFFTKLTRAGISSLTELTRAGISSHFAQGMPLH